MHRKIFNVALTYIIVFIIPIGIFAATPSKNLGFQGQLYSSGAPLSSSVNATFTFYDSLSGGTVTGSPISKTITVNNGYFGTSFTEADTTGVNFDQALYVQVNINGTDLSPRTAINSNVSSLKTFGTFTYSSAPAVGPAGSLYFNTTDNTLYMSNGTSWTPSSPWITNGTDAYFSGSGNIGIGTTTPTSALTVNRSGTTASIMISSYRGSEAHGSLIGRGARGTDTVPTFLLNANDGDRIFEVSGQVWNGSSFTTAAGMQFYGKNHSSSSLPTYIRFNTTAVNTIAPREVMRLTADGSVGIGTSVPVAILSVHGSASTTMDLFNVASTTAINYLTVKNGGNVGVGTSTPTAQFTTTGTVRFA
ncbi:MAG: hypothetical protein V4576_04370, partial [Patescibacteria group bacterium]